MFARTAGRKGRPWRRARAAVLGVSTVCWICGHDGAGDVDHIRARSLGGHPTDPDNLRPAHGAFSRCPVCRRACNQARGVGRRVLLPVPVLNTSRPW